MSAVAVAKTERRADWNLTTALMVRVLSYFPVLELVLVSRRVCKHWNRTVPVATATACTRLYLGQFWASIGVVSEYAGVWPRLVRALGFYQIRSLSFAFCDHLSDDLFLTLIRLLSDATTKRARARAAALTNPTAAASLVHAQSHGAGAATAASPELIGTAHANALALATNARLTAAAGAPPVATATAPTAASSAPGASTIAGAAHQIDAITPGAVPVSLPELAREHRLELYHASISGLTKIARRHYSDATAAAGLDDTVLTRLSTATAAAVAASTAAATALPAAASAAAPQVAGSSTELSSHAVPTSPLTTLDLYYCYRLTDSAVVEAVARFPNLTVLNLGRCFALTDRAVRACATLKYLKHLNLSSNPNLNRDSLQLLETFPSLVTLDIQYCSQLDSAVVDEMRRTTSITITGPDHPKPAEPTDSNGNAASTGGNNGTAAGGGANSSGSNSGVSTATTHDPHSS